MEKIANYISYNPDSDSLLISASDIVCSHVYEYFGETALKFIDPNLLNFITKLMKTQFAGKYMLINNYSNTSITDLGVTEPISEERGLRCNNCYTVITSTDHEQCYVNSHTLGKGIDFDIYDLQGEVLVRESPATVRRVIEGLVELEGDYVRMEFTDSDWVHIDTLVSSEPVKIEALEDYASDPPMLFIQQSSDLIDWSKSDTLVSVGSTLNYTPTAYDYSQLTKSYSTINLAKIKESDIQGIDHLMKYNAGASSEMIRKRILTVALNMGCHPNWLMAIILSESGGKPNIWNGTTAVGLIQFTKIACKALNTDQKYLSTLSTYEQLVWVNKYFQLPYTFGGSKKVSRLSDVYVATFAPSFIGYAGDHILYKSPNKAYTMNKALDYGNKGYITVDDLLVRTVKVARNYGISL